MEYWIIYAILETPDFLHSFNEPQITNIINIDVKCQKLKIVFSNY